MEVVSEVLDGKLGNSITNSGGRGNLIHLTPSYRGLSAGGDDIAVYRRDVQTLIFFFDFRGILDSFSGLSIPRGTPSPRAVISVESSSKLKNSVLAGIGLLRPIRPAELKATQGPLRLGKA